MTSSELHNASTEIASYLSEHPEALKALEQEQNATVKPEPNAAYKAVRRATSNAQGQVSFDHLVHGVYLITQEGREGTAKEFTPLSPVLFFVPQYLKTETGAGWLYDVVANPKYSPEKPEESSSTPPETPPKPPKPSTPKPTPTPGTGDKIRLGIWAGTGLLAFLALLLLFTRTPPPSSMRRAAAFSLLVEGTRQDIDRHAACYWRLGRIATGNGVGGAV